MDPALRTLPEKSDPSIKPIASFEFDFSESFLPSGLFSRFLAIVVEYASTMEDSRAPGVTRNSARLSFGVDAEFSLDVCNYNTAIRVGIAGDVPLTLKTLTSIMERVREETVPRLKYDVVLLVPGNDDRKVPLDQILEERKKVKPKAQVRSTIDQQLVSLSAVEIFFTTNQQDVPVTKLSSITSDAYDIYLAHVQASGGDQCNVLRLELEKYGVVAWLDQHATEITQKEMESNIIKSKKILVFLSKGVFQSEWVQFEVRTAIKLNKPILFVHETNAKREGFEEIYDIKANTPTDLQYLFKDVESIGFERRSYLVEGMMKELTRRING
jgi:hypothetical protein